MLRLEQLRVLTAIAETGSLAGAGRALFISQPTVSHHLAALEANIGGLLVQRGPRGARLTSMGELVAQRANGILAAVNRVERDALNHRLATLRVGSFPSATGPLLTGPLASLRARRIDFELLVAEATQIAAHVRELVFDVAIVTSEPGVAPTFPSEVVTTPLVRDPLLVWIPDGHPLVARSELTLADLLHNRWITTTGDDDPEYTLLRRAFAQAGQEFQPTIRADDFDVTKALVAAGLGLSLLPRLAVTQTAAGINARRVADPRFARQLHLVWREDRPDATEFVEDVRCTAASLPERPPAP